MDFYWKIFFNLFRRLLDKIYLFSSSPEDGTKVSIT
jgi:hypothetical protein